MSLSLMHTPVLACGQGRERKTGVSKCVLVEVLPRWQRLL